MELCWIVFVGARSTTGCQINQNFGEAFFLTCISYFKIVQIGQGQLKGIRLSRTPDNELCFLAGGVRIQACDG